MNASTFTARVITSTGADVAAAFSGAIGAMSGPLHGGAPSRVLGMIEEVEKRDGDATSYVKELLDSGERLMGFGHRVYRAEDPRARVLRRTAKELDAPRYEVAEALEQAALAELRERRPGPGARDQRGVLGRDRARLRRGAGAHVHLDVHLRAHRWLVGAHPRAEDDRPADPAVGDLHRPGVAPGLRRSTGGGPSGTSEDRRRRALRRQDRDRHRRRLGHRRRADPRPGGAPARTWSAPTSTRWPRPATVASVTGPGSARAGRARRHRRRRRPGAGRLGASPDLLFNNAGITLRRRDRGPHPRPVERDHRRQHPRRRARRRARRTR